MNKIKMYSFLMYFLSLIHSPIFVFTFFFFFSVPVDMCWNDVFLWSWWEAGLICHVHVRLRLHSAHAAVCDYGVCISEWQWLSGGPSLCRTASGSSSSSFLLLLLLSRWCGQQTGRLRPDRRGTNTAGESSQGQTCSFLALQFLRCIWVHPEVCVIFACTYIFS